MVKLTEISYRKPKLSEALQISILLKTVNIQAYAVDGVRREMATYITKRFSLEYVENAIKDSFCRFIVAYINENPIGVAEIIYNNKCPIGMEEMPELSKLYVLERFYGKGIGFNLLKKVEKELYSKGFDKIFLEVFTENPEAILFYERQLYKKIGKVDFPMQDNTYENWVMTKTLNC